MRMGCADKAPLVALALDGELGPADVAELDRHLAECSACAVEYAQLKALRQSLRAALPRPEAPPELRRRILAAIPDPRPVRRFRRIGWPTVLAAALGSAVAASLATFLLVHPTEEDRMTQEIVSSHVRSLVSGHLTDLAASDPGEVEPWFNGRLDMAPPVRDLSAEGFQLAGARVDYLDRNRTAALVYRRGAHVFSLYVLDTPKQPEGDSDAVLRQGYAVCHWTKNGLTFWAVADVDPEQLEAFEDLVTGKG
jgi:anti-sigma factor (TIGR02949 family)